jgi:hypothetical protein
MACFINDVAGDRVKEVEIGGLDASATVVTSARLGFRYLYSMRRSPSTFPIDATGSSVGLAEISMMRSPVLGLNVQIGASSLG